MIRTARIKVTTTGAAGSAAGEAYSPAPVNGLLQALHVDWHASAPGGTSDITITVEADANHPAVTLYTKANSATDAWVYPTVEETDTGGTGVSTYRDIPVAGRIRVQVAQCDALTDAVVVTAYVVE